MPVNYLVAAKSIDHYKYSTFNIFLAMLVYNHLETGGSKVAQLFWCDPNVLSDSSNHRNQPLFDSPDHENDGNDIQPSYYLCHKVIFNVFVNWEHVLANWGTGDYLSRGSVFATLGERTLFKGDSIQIAKIFENVVYNPEGL